MLAVGVTASVLLVGCSGGDPSIPSSAGGTDTGAVSVSVSEGRPPSDSSPVPSSQVVSTSPSTPATTTPTSTSTSTSTAPEVPLGDVGLTGVNVTGCVSDAPPVVLLHGTLSSIAVDYAVLVPALLTAGRCVYGADYGRSGLGPVRDSATQAAAVIQQVRSMTGAATVDVVGFSQGGLVLRTALRLDGVADAVGTAVLISPSFHGSTSAVVSSAPAALCPACVDQTAGSELLTQLAVGGDLDGDVRYAVVVTSVDAVVTPWESQLPAGPADRVRSVVLDRQCLGLIVAHQDMARTPAVVGWVVAALAAAGEVSADAVIC